MTRLRRREIVNEATREAMDVIQAKSVNAKASTSGTVKVSMGRDFRFGTRSAEAVAA
jgi:hypothetical protein